MHNVLTNGKKCGTIKENGTLVSAYNQPENALQVIKRICKEQNNTLIIPECKEIEIIEQSIFGMHFNYKKQAYRTALSGVHQVQNMTTVIEAINVLIKKGYNITEQNIKDYVQENLLYYITPYMIEIIQKYNINVNVTDDEIKSDYIRLICDFIKENIMKEDLKN